MIFFFADAILDNVKGPEDTDDKQKDQKTEQEAIDETVAKCKGQFQSIVPISKLFDFFLLVLQKAGRHMEDTLIASYVTLIIGYLIKDNKVRFWKWLRFFNPEQFRQFFLVHFLQNILKVKMSKTSILATQCFFFLFDNFFREIKVNS